MNAKRTGFPSRSIGRRKADQRWADRVREEIKPMVRLVVEIIGGLLLIYFAGVGGWIQARDTWESATRPAVRR